MPVYNIGTLSAPSPTGSQTGTVSGRAPRSVAAHGSSPIILTHRTENLQRPRRLVEHHDLVPHIAENAPDIARLQRLLFVADGEDHPPFQQDADLLMGM